MPLGQGFLARFGLVWPVVIEEELLLQILSAQPPASAVVAVSPFVANSVGNLNFVLLKFLSCIMQI